MVKLKRILAMLLVIVFLAGITPAFAQARYGTRKSRPVESTAIVTDADGNAMDYPVWVYGISIFADAANSYMGVYDVDTLLEINTATTYPKDEIGEATQYDTEIRNYTKPEYYADGVGVIIFTGVGFIQYGPEPTS